MKKPALRRLFLPGVAAVGILVAASLVFAGQPERARRDPLRKPASPPKELTRYGMVAGSGIVEPSSELVEVGAQSDGVVTRVFVQAGERVSKGQLLFTVDGRSAASNLSEARAGVELARSQVQAAAVDLAAADRQLRLYLNVSDPRAVAQQQINDRRAVRDQAAARLAVARSEMHSAEARLASARTSAELLQVRAPLRPSTGSACSSGSAPLALCSSSIISFPP